MLDDFSHELDSTQSRLDNVMKKLAKVSHMTSGRSREAGSGPGEGEASLRIFGLGHCVLPPADGQPRAERRGGSGSRCLKEGEDFQALQFAPAQTLPCSLSSAFVLFTDAFLFTLLLPRWENPSLDGRRGSSAASCSAAVSRAACGAKAFEVP